MFIDRQHELEHLRRQYEAPGAQLYVLYGRRRVGKTELLRHFCADRPSVFHVATLASDQNELARFSASIARADSGASSADAPVFPSWEAAFHALDRIPGRPVVVLDEFTYLLSANKALPSTLQAVWDHRLSQGNLMLVLCGSFIGMMEREILGHRSALYGRRTAGLHLQPLDLPSSSLFFPRYEPLDRVEAWSILGGMPYYLRTFDDRTTVAENLRRTIVSTDALLYDEPQLLLQEELREPRNYFSVLRAIAEGNRRSNAITQAARIGDARKTARYLDILREMRIVTREVPITEHRPEKSRLGLYDIDDPFLRFWFRFVHPFRGALELGMADAILEQRILPHLPQHTAWAFERASRAHLATMARTSALGFLPERIGHWWSRDSEIDVAAISDTDGILLLGECKWTRRPVGTELLDRLHHKAAGVDPQGRWPDRRFALFSRAGFTDTLRARAAKEDVLLITADEMVTGETASD